MNLREIKRNQYLQTVGFAQHTDRHHYEDLAFYHERLPQIHNSTLHDWGVAWGLEVCSTGPTTLQINPGVAVDLQGQMIVLTPTTTTSPVEGQAYVYDPPIQTTVPVRVDVPTNGVNVPHYLTIEHKWNKIDRPNEPDLWVHQPWIRLQEAAAYDAESPTSANPAIVLAVVTQQGTTVTVSHSLPGLDHGRRVVGARVGALQVRRPLAVNGQVSDDTAATIAPMDDGGLLIADKDGDYLPQINLKGRMTVTNRLTVEDKLRVPRLQADVEAILGKTTAGSLTVNGRVGIGTTSPAVEGLHIGKSVEGGQARIQLDNAVSNQSGQINRWTNRLEILASDALELAVGGIGATKMRIDAQGNVGIGTAAPPQARLQVAGGAMMPAAGNSGQAGILFPKDPGGGAGDAAWIRYYARPGEDSPESTTLEIGVANDLQDHIALMPSGGVGIGTTKPDNAEGWGRFLELRGPAGNARLSVRSNAIDGRVMVHEGGWYGSPSGMIIGTSTPHALSFATAGKTRMTIDASGNVSIGGTIQQENWQNLQLQNGWQVYGAPWGSPGCFRDKHGVVHLRGLIKGGQIGYAAPHIAILPEGYRPEHRAIFAVISGNDKLGRCDIDADGKIYAGVGENHFFSLEGITFRARGF